MTCVSGFYSKTHVFSWMLFGNLSTVSYVASGSFCDNSAKSLMVIVFVSPGCYNKCHQLGALNNTHLFLTVLEAGTPRSRHWKIQFLVRALFLAYPQGSSHWPFTRLWDSVGRAHALVSSNDTNHIMGTPLL